MQRLPDLIARVARSFGPRPALAIRRGLRTDTWTYAQLADDVGRAAVSLRKRGLRPGDRVLVLAPNSPELVISMFAAWQAGGVLVPLDLASPADMVQRIRTASEPVLLIAERAIEGLDDLPRVSPAGLRAWEHGSVGAWGREQAASHALTLPRSHAPMLPRSHAPMLSVPDGLAEIVYTSGTTGAPRGVMLTHANILANVAAARDAVPIRAGTRVLSILPLSHMLEQTVGLLTALASGTTIFYTTSRRSSALLTAMQRHRIQLLVCVPEVLRVLLAGIEREVERCGRRRQWERALERAERLPMALRPLLFGEVHRRLGGCLRLVQCGGAPLDAGLWRTWERLGVRVVEGYGATECSPIVTSNRLERRRPGSVGWPLRGVSVRLAEDGEIQVRGPNVTPGYWRDPLASAADRAGDWYRTGDVGAFGPAGELRLLGRKKEMIVLPSGLNVFPQDVEEAIKQDPAIKECAVVGMPRTGGGVEVHAVVVPSGDPAAAVAATRRASARLAPHQQVGGMTIWPGPDLPRTSSLKVKRLAVLEAIRRADGPSHPHTPPSRPADDLAGRLRGLVAQATGRSIAEVRPEAELSLDLGLDSLARVELAVLVEEQLGRALSDDEMASLRTVADLTAAVERATAGAAAEPLPSWPRRLPARLARDLLQRAMLLPIQGRLCRPMRVRGAEHLGRLRGPALIVANHASHLDAPSVLAILPPARRRRTAVAAAADYFFAREPLATASALLLGAFPFHRQGPVAASLAHCGDLADAGYTILVFPEGTRSADGRLLPFKPGIGLLARQLGLPVLPVRLDGLHRILPKGRLWPRPGPLTVTIGEPLRIDPARSNAEVAAELEAAVRNLEQTAE